MKQIGSTVCASPIGEIAVFGDHDTLYLLDFNDNRDRINELLTRRFGDFEIRQADNLLGIRDRLEKYFSCDWGAFRDIDLDTHGSEFQQGVWRALRAIPVGETVSYSLLARQIGKPNAVRAVASANAANPVAIIVPCHRVIGKNGAMRGYAGGVDRKTWLLKHEQAIL